MPALPRKILYVSPNAKLGGAEQSLGQWARLHDRSRWVPAIYFLSDGPLVSQLRGQGIECEVHAGAAPRLRSPASVLAASRAIAAYARRSGTALVHSVMGYGHLFGGPGALLAGVPEVWYQHGPTGRLDWLTGRVPTRALFVNSEYTRREQARYRAWAPRVRVIYPGTETPKADGFGPERREFRSRYGIADDEVVFALMARFSPMKGHPVFLDAAARVAREHPKSRFLVVGGPFSEGDREYERAIHERGRALGLADRVIYTGFLGGSQYPVIAASDVMVNASVIPEPFGLTVIEAMVVQKPVIGPSIGGPAEVIGHGVDGYLFAPGDAASLAERMSRLAGSEDERRRFGERGRAKAIERFDIRRVVRELEEEYERLL